MEKNKIINLKICMSVIIMIGILLFAFIVLLPDESLNNQENVNNIEDKKSNHTLIPKPAEYEEKEGKFTINENTNICVKGNNERETSELYKIGEYLKSKLQKSTGYKLDIIKDSQKNDKGDIFLTTINGEEIEGNEGYSINVDNDVLKVQGYKPEGIFRGVQTVRQLLPSDIEKSELAVNSNWQIPNVEIKDKPEYEYRGIMIDVARNFFEVKDIKREIDLAAQYKINRVHLHLSDDQGWRLEIKKWPDLTTIGGSTRIFGGPGGYYTQEEFKDIVSYAQERYIEIIPEFEMPGHTNAALASYGFLNKNGQKKTLYTGAEVGFSSLMCRDEATYEFIEDIIKEVSEISPSKYIHIGGDESDSTKKEDYDYFMGRVSKIVNKYGKVTIGWDPIDTSQDIDNNIILQNWKNSNEAAREKNIKMIISIAGKAYLDMKYDNSTPYGLVWAGYNSTRDSYEWDPTDYAPKELVLGVEAPLWAETINNSDIMDYMIYPRLLGHAEIGWSSKNLRDWNDYKVRLEAQGERLENQGVNYYKDPSIWGK